MDKYKYKVVDNNGGSFSVPMGSDFYLNYAKNATVKALKGSLGIMVFSNLKAAEHFLLTVCHGISSGRVKRVIPIGKKTAPQWISRWTVTDRRMKAFNEIPLEERCNNFLCSAAPRGTECYPEVIVVD